MSKKPPTNQSTVSRQLLQYIERWERLEEEKKNIAADQKDVLAEAKSCGFDVKTIREIIKLRKMTPDQRREREALLDTYKAALGMLDGTPLGSWALDRLSKDDDDGDDGEALPQDPPAPPPEPAATVEDARALGKQAAEAGKPVTSNPFPARDPRRAAWDEAWCQAIGSDGMDIPEAWRPKAKKPDPAEKDPAE